MLHCRNHITRYLTPLSLRVVLSLSLSALQQMDREETSIISPSPPPPSPPPSIPPPFSPPSYPPDVAVVVVASVAGGTVGAAVAGSVIATLVAGYYARKLEKARRLRARKRMQKSMGGLKAAMKAQSGGKMNVSDIIALSKLGAAGAGGASGLIEAGRDASTKPEEPKIDPGVAALFSGKCSGSGVSPKVARPPGSSAAGALGAFGKAAGGGAADSSSGAAAACPLGAFCKPAGGGAGGSGLSAFSKAGGVKVVDAGVRPSSAAKRPATGVSLAAASAGKAKEPAGKLKKQQTISQRLGMSASHFKSFVLRKPPPKLGSSRLDHGGATKNLLSEQEMARRRKERDKRMAKEKKERDRKKREAVREIYSAPTEVDEFGWGESNIRDRNLCAAVRPAPPWS